MKILMESTEHVVSIDGVECRVWNGVTENDTQCFVMVHRIMVRKTEDQAEFAELYEQVSNVEVIKAQ
jgi:hypothetical protein